MADPIDELVQRWKQSPSSSATIALCDALRGSAPTEPVVRKAAETIGSDLDPISDSHGDAEYRREMAKVVASRAVLEAIGKSGRRS